MQLHPPTTTAERSASRSDVQAGTPGGVSLLRRRILWIGAVVSLILLLIFVPPLVNANHYQRQIARSMSESLGRPVHLDNVTLHLLPVPGLTLSNLVVSEDPSFGAEPTIRANTVEATLRLGSLWRRRVEFSTVRFVDPSVNLVRNPEGRWNLASVLLHAAHVNTAPTIQRRAGPAPRFPYIEATGGRVNIKFGEEKLPFSLTDADFALWLPSANQWRVRLRGQPARTDANLNEPGTLRIEGDLQRSDTPTGVPVNLRASWHDARLGEASRLLTGNDMGWRGTLNLDASLAGTLSAAQLKAQLTLGGLRRAEFAPAHPLDLQISCGSTARVSLFSLADVLCTMPDSAPEPMVLQAATLDLVRPAQAQATLTATDVPAHWGLEWAALFSPRIPTDLQGEGGLDLTLQHTPGTASAPPVAPPHARQRRSRRVAAALPAVPSGWSGELQVHLPPAVASSFGDATGSPAVPKPGTSDPEPTNLVWHIVPIPASPPSPGRLSLVLQPVTIPTGPNAALNLLATISPAGYTVDVLGAASATALLMPARYLPQLGDGLDGVLPFPPTAGQSVKVDFTCNHPWGAVQTCTALRPTVTNGRPAAVLPASVLPAQRSPVLLAPRSLSPLDRDPRLGAPQPDQPNPMNPPGSPRL